MMKRILAMAMACLCVTGILSIAAQGVAEETPDTVYKYALLGDVYIPEAGLVSASAPDGKAIPADTQQVLLDWSEGSYLFHYENKTVNLKVYESAPKDTLTVNGTVPAATSEGLKTWFPGLTAESGIRRTDGAPAVEDYQVSAALWYNGKQMQLIQNATQAFWYTPTESGLWMVSYQYTDVFGCVRSQDYPFTVTSDRIIVSQINEQYYVGNTVGSGDAYGYYNGKQYPVSMELQCPDGTSRTVEEKLILSQEGSYTLSASVEIEGQTVTESYAFSVQSGLQSFLTAMEGFGKWVTGDKHENNEALSGSSQGLLLDMTASTAGFTYNGVVDLNALGSETPVISFTPNHTYGGSINKVVVTLTDVYDASNSVSVTFSRNSDMTERAVSFDNTLVQASFDNTALAVNNFYHLQNYAVGWDTTFHNYWSSPSYENPEKTYNPRTLCHAMNFTFDMATNTVLCYGNFSLVDWGDKTTPAGYPKEYGNRWYPIADLDNDTLLSKFKGFTTGEVYVKLEVQAGRGDIMLHSIGGVSLANLQEGYQTNTGILLEGFDGSMDAAVGVAYSLPAGTGRYVDALTSTVTFENVATEGTSQAVIPEKTGNYTVLYEGINQFGIPVSKSVSFRAVEKLELYVDYPTPNVTVGQLYTVETPTLTGYGSLSYAMTLNGQAVQPGQRVWVQEEMVISVTAEDALDTVEKTFVLNVDRDAVDFRVDFPRTAICGSSFSFPKAEIYDYLTGTALNYEIYANGVKQEASMTLPENPGTVTVEYRTARGSKKYTLYVRSDEVSTGADALLLPAGGSAETTDAGTVVTVTAGAPVVQLPYKLSATSLPFQFIVLQEQLNFNTMTIRMTSSAGTSITASVSGLQEDTPYLYINGQNTGVKLNKQSQTYTSGTYEGKSYYTYTLEYHDMHRAMMNAARIEAVVNTDSYGVDFTGFGDGVYLDIYPEDMQGGTATYGITQVSNQYFYSSAFEYGDIVAPVPYTTDFYIGNNNVSSGYVLRLSNLKAFDVLRPGKTVEVTVVRPDGTPYSQNEDPAVVGDLVLDKPGVYTLKIKAEDGSGVKLDMTCRFTVEDEQAPVLTVSGQLAKTAKAGSSLTLPGASASDDNACTVRIAVFSPDGKITHFGGTDKELSAATLKNLMQGTYRIRYFAVDELGNIATQVYTVTVEG